MNSDVVDFPAMGRSRPFGISGILRFKYSSQFIEQVVRSFLPFLDELAAVYSESDKQTLAIMDRLFNEFPDKIRIYQYPHRVAGIGNPKHRALSRKDPASIANYYNWAFSKARFSVVTKIDDDHLPILPAFQQAVIRIRKKRPKQFIYTYSGINIFVRNGRLHCPLDQVFVGLGDHWFLDLADDLYFDQDEAYEILRFTGLKRTRLHLGLLYWHLKFEKQDLGALNADADSQTESNVKTFIDSIDKNRAKLLADIIAESRKHIHFYNMRNVYSDRFEGVNPLAVRILSWWKLPFHRLKKNRYYLNAFHLYRLRDPGAELLHPGDPFKA
jgi:hypothetical protein